MGDNFNTVAGWALFAGIVALGGSIVSHKIFHQERPEEMGYAIAGVEAEGGEGGEAAVPLPVLLAKADVAAGEKVFGKCAACHTINEGGANGIGPNLHGVVGKPHGMHPGFAYTDALKKVPGNWDFEALNKWLTSPRDYAPGTKMTFAGLSNPQGSNLPLPKVEAAAPAEGANAAAPAEAGNAANAAAPAANAAAK